MQSRLAGDPACAHELSGNTEIQKLRTAELERLRYHLRRATRKMLMSIRSTGIENRSNFRDHAGIEDCSQAGGLHGLAVGEDYFRIGEAWIRGGRRVFGQQSDALGGGAAQRLSGVQHGDTTRILLDHDFRAFAGAVRKRREAARRFASSDLSPWERQRCIGN